MKEGLKTGITGEFGAVVEERHLAINLGSGLVSVLSSPMMIAGMETAAVDAVQPYLEEGKTAVGFHIDVSHEAPTPAGMKVKFKAILTDISENGRILTFDVEASDECGLIGRGTHKRVIVDKKKFEERAQGKKDVCPVRHS